MVKKSGLYLFNSLRQKKEKFNPPENTVSVYVCGVTPYDITHLGHAFTYVSFDVIVRYLAFIGFHVVYVQNVTDIDDDILKKAKAENKDWRVLAERNFSDYLKDADFLNLRQPDYYPKATDHIGEIIDFNNILLTKNYAYEKNGNLYFDIKKFSGYGKLSRLSKVKMLPVSRERGNNPDDPDKKNPLDFVLWQKKVPGEPYWESPWGPGRPGWHIECSTMSMKYLGQTLDIHGGGGDLIFPHHESEIAQSEAATGISFARFFIHTAMLYYQGKKMSKSLGNMVFIRNLKNYSNNTIRLLLLSNHYRQEWQYSEDMLNKARKLNGLFRKVWLVQSGRNGEFSFNNYRQKFFEALNDDMNTPQALGILENLSKNLINNRNKRLSSAKAFLNQAFNILGLIVEY